MKESVSFLQMFSEYRPGEDLSGVLSVVRITGADLDPATRQAVVTDAGRAVSPPVWGSAEGVPPGAGLPPPAAPQAARMHRHRYTLKNRHHFFITPPPLHGL